MLDYVKSQLREMFPQQEKDNVQEQLMDQAILDCAHLFQEFDDLSMNGSITNGARQFTNVDIPLEDDIEVTSVEMNLLDGRVMVPMDATVQETSDYSRMKTFDDFYQEALENTRPLGRETRGVFEDRCARIAERNYQEYSEYIVQEGLFGFDKIKITDPSVPSQCQVHLGNRNGHEYIVYLDVYFIVDRKDRITKKQLESIQLFGYMMKRPDSGKGLQEVVFEQFGGMCGCSSADDIWEHAKPVKLVVPVEPADQYCAKIEFEFEDIDQHHRLVWHIPVKSVPRGQKPTEKALSFKKDTSAGGSEHAITKKEGKKHVAEAATYKPRELNRFVNDDDYYQEAIDFGNSDAPPASPDESQSSVSFGNDAAGGGDATPDAPPAEGEAPAEPKEVADSNDVSQQIAEKVADETQNAASEDEGLSVDGVEDAAADADVSDVDSDTPTEEDVNAELGDADENSVDDAGAAASDVDVDNMTPEELKAAAADKIEKMTFQQIKDFLNDGAEAAPDDEPPAADGEVQEAFFLTRWNIGKELDVHLRKTLGVLNDSEMNIEQLCSKFRKQGKRLNRRVHKAAKMTDVFNEGERKQLLKLNALLTDLMAVMRSDIDKSEVPTVKRLVKAFVQQATGVAKLVEQKSPDKPVQESYYPLDPEKVKSHYAEVESMVGRPLPDGYKRIIEYGIENIGIKGADGLLQGCMWEINTGDLKDHDKFDYDGHPGSEFIPLANNGRGDEILMGNTSKTDTRIFTYIHDAKDGLKQIAASWDEFEDLLYTRSESDAKYDTMKMKFFGKECPVRIPRGISLKDTFTSIDLANNCDSHLDDSVRGMIRKHMEWWKSEMTEDELKSADWKHPENHLKPVYIYVNDHDSRTSRSERYAWAMAIDCDWEYDPEHGLGIMFNENMTVRAVGPMGDYL